MLNNPFMDALAGETYTKQFVFTRNRADGTAEFVGGTGWGAEFGIIDPEDNRVLLAVATVQNNKAAWAGAGVLWIAFPQTETITWQWQRGSWYLDLIMPNTNIDPNGYRETVLRGTMKCSPRAPGRLDHFQLQFP